ncbi:hypothetical protein B0H17DRAFT_1192040 [Mycena rosella]|uniref:Uncharacterized protein n=1 Tax=Mycena rosella TaxID=1033263 RepID=A0AAD7GXM9_MYCRO|nr:hypothetical protein B0H17DRAFT_1192040 [Mycena rosella]
MVDSLRLFYTWSDGADLELTSWRHYEGTARHHLYERGCDILALYAELLVGLGPSKILPGHLRLQNALAAACDDVSLVEFAEMSDDELAKLRSRYNMLFCLQTAPPLVIYLGGKRRLLIPSSPSTSGTLSYAALADVQNQDEDEDLDARPWNNSWDAAHGPWPCAWGYYVRGRTNHSHYIFLSGAYVAWTDRWKGLARRPMLERLNIHMEATMYHELIHVARTQMHGRTKMIPEKTIDDKELAVNGVGEAGRFAELLAFGSVVDMYLSDKFLQIFSTDVASPERLDYELNEDTLRNLFSSGTPAPPIDFHILSTQRPLLNLPDYCRRKDGACPVIELDTEETLVAPPSRPSPTIVDSSVRLITGERAAMLRAQRSELKRCVEVG